MLGPSNESEGSKMETYTRKIASFSGVVYVLAQIVFWAMLALSAFLALGYILAIAAPYTSSNVLGATFTLPASHHVDGRQVLLPGFDFAGYGLNFTVNMSTIIGFVLTLLPLGAARRLFNALRIDGNPFRPEIVRLIKRLAIVLLLIGVFGGIIGFIGAALVMVLYFIFDYGTALHLESETTL